MIICKWSSPDGRFGMTRSPVISVDAAGKILAKVCNFE